MTRSLLGRTGPALFLASAMVLPAAAADRRQSFEVSASVVRGCVVTAEAGGRWGAISLGTVNGLPGTSATGTLLSGGVAGLALSCTPGTRVNVTADAGDHAVAGQRRLQRNGGNEALGYALYADGGTTAWTTQAVTLTFADDVARRMLPVTASATLAQAMPAGTYTDTVRVTLTF